MSFPKENEFNFQQNVFIFCRFQPYFTAVSLAVKKCQATEEEKVEQVIVECSCNRCKNELRIRQERLKWKPVKSNPCHLFLARLDYKSTESSIAKELSKFGLVKNGKMQKRLTFV